MSDNILENIWSIGSKNLKIDSECDVDLYDPNESYNTFLNFIGRNEQKASLEIDNLLIMQDLATAPTKIHPLKLKQISNSVSYQLFGYSFIFNDFQVI